jgi:hypothetical protein
MAMNPEVKAEWVKALRSGEYKQTKNLLHKVGGGFCCLGVLCELAVKAGVIPAASRDKDDDPSAWFYEGEESVTPGRVDRWAGITGADSGTVDGLVAANDGGIKFPAIADMIEERL